jgi:hypothetical protein
MRLRNRKAARKHVDELASWLREDDGQAALRAAARSHGDGLLKLEPSALSLLRIPATLARSIDK